MEAEVEVRKRDTGFSLVELMIAVVVIGILASIAIPGLLNAVQRGRQKRTMADIRSLGTAVESYALDTSHYPRNYGPGPVEGGVEADLEPYFIVASPLKDGWYNPMLYTSDARGTLYTMTSLGSDGVPDSGTGGPTGDFDCDIEFSNGQFVQWPEGMQT